MVCQIWGSQAREGFTPPLLHFQILHVPWILYSLLLYLCILFVCILKCNNKFFVLLLLLLVVDGNEIKDKITIVEKFNDFFINVGPNLAASINTQGKKHFTSYLTQKIEHTFNFEQVSVENITDIIRKFESKTSTGHDNLSMKLFKRIAPSIFEPLTCIINQSLSSGIFPRSLKIAKVIPLFKKDNDKIVDNYRPISLLPAISKVFEKCAFNQLYEYLKKTQIILYQSIRFP